MKNFCRKTRLDCGIFLVYNIITMMKNALIKIKDSKNNESVILADGVVRRENDAFYIEYETENDKFVIGVSSGIVTVSRIAQESYTMVMQQDKPRTFDLNTAYGAVTLSLTATKVEYFHNDGGLDLLLEYNIKTASGTAEESQFFRLSVECLYK